MASLATVPTYILFQKETIQLAVFVIKVEPSIYYPWNMRKKCPYRGNVGAGGSMEMKVLFF